MGRTMQDVPSTGHDNKVDTARQKSRRQPCCGFCRNHYLEVPVVNHHCEYAECTCPLCELTRRRRRIMRHQQRLWRYKKFSTGQKEGEENPSEDEVTQNGNSPQEGQQMEMLDPARQQVRRKMVCDKCRNHDILVKKRGHKGSCPFEACDCDLCSFTIKRQQLMKHQQRVRRSQIAGPMEHPEKSQPQTLSSADSPDSDLQSVEEVAPTSPPRGSLEERKEEGTEARKSPSVLAAPQDMPCTAIWASTAKECATEDAPRPQDNFHPITTTTTCQPPPLEPLPDYQVTSDIHSPLTFNKNDHNLNAAPRIECPGNVRLSVRCGCFESLPQVPAASATLPSFPAYGLDVDYHRFVPWTGRVSETSERCTVEVNHDARPQAPLRPHPIPAAHLPRSQMGLQFIGFPYSPSSMLQSVPQPTLSVCNNLRSHHPQACLNEQWQGTKGPHPTESNGVHSPYSAGLPYLASALLHPSAKPSLSLMSTSRTLPDYGSQLPGYRQQDQYQINPLQAFTRSCNNVM